MSRRLNILTTLQMSFIIAFFCMNCVVISAFGFITDDEAAIKYLLFRYQQGYQTKNLEVIRSCFEALGTVEEAKLKHQLAKMESISLAFKNISIKILLTKEPRSYDAQLTCDANLTYTVKGEATPKTILQHYFFGLVQKENPRGLKEWKIRAMDITGDLITMPKKQVEETVVKEDYSRELEQKTEELLVEKRIEALRKKKPSEMTEEEFQTYLLIQQKSLLERQNSLIEQHTKRVRKWQIFDVVYRIVPLAFGIVVTIIILAD